MNNTQKYKANFVQRLSELMETKNISAFSRKINIPERTINGWMKMQTSPRMEYLIELSLFFNVSIDYLVGLEYELGNKKLKS